MTNLKKYLIFITLTVLLCVTGCNKKYEKNINIDNLCNCNKIENCKCKNMYQTITGEQAKKLIYVGNTFLVDVRSEAEYNSGHIEGAMSIPLDEIENINFAKNINFIVYCRSGSRSKMAATKLLELGYVNVYDLGSMDNWQE